MSRLSSPTAVRVNRRHYVNVESKTVRNDRLSYRALGLLVFLLDQKEGWQVRSDQLSKGEGREGRTAVRNALRELADEGYYRLERRRLLDNQYAMGTAISEYPVESWKRDNKIFSSKRDPAVPVVEQKDGTFLVQYPDGSLGSDGFEADPYYNEEPPADPEDEPKGPAAEEEHPPEAEPPAAPPKPPARARRPRRTSAQKAADDAAKAAAAEKKAEEKAALAAAAKAIADWWWDGAERHFGRYVGKNNGYLAMRGMVTRALEAGYTQRQCQNALRHARKHLPSAQQWQTALGVASNHIPPAQPNGRVPYSDAATWGEQTSTPPGAADTTPGSTSPDDDAQFGVIARP
ncbi:hypothetical protein ACIP93_33425 [Streptomyces sp. NPDC088745]|uniref:hypothetical protein n=1 Tax=Streptomyces sp. NPDC088745 TaxID=3365884 RepID=UPI0037F230B8